MCSGISGDVLRKTVAGVATQRVVGNRFVGGGVCHLYGLPYATDHTHWGCAQTRTVE